MQYNRIKSNLLKTSLFLVISTSFLHASYFEDAKKGWFWGEKKEVKKEEVLPSFDNIKSNEQFSSENLKKLQEEVKKNEQVIIYQGKELRTISQKTSVPPKNILDKLHPDEIANLETETKSISVMYPTQANVLEYKKLQKYITDKAMGFTDTSYFVTKQDPEISAWASESLDSRLKISTERVTLDKEQKSVLDKYKNNIIILVATLPTCPYCKEQLPLLKTFHEQYGIEFKEIDISTNQEFAKKYEVQRTPDLFLLYKNEKNDGEMTRFGNGLHTLSDLKNGVLASLFTFGKVSKDLLEY